MFEFRTNNGMSLPREETEVEEDCRDLYAAGVGTLRTSDKVAKGEAEPVDLRLPVAALLERAIDLSEGDKARCRKRW